MTPSRPVALLRLLRPLQWSKNAFVLVGALFAHRWEAPVLLAVATLVAAFCCMASAAYVFNDLQDVEADRAHPDKRHRPLASGEIPAAWAWALSPALASAGLGLAAAVSTSAVVFVLLYGLINVAYSLRLKHVVIVDVFVIAAGFMLRILAGTVGVGIPPSSWLLVCGLMLTLFIGFSKRTAELHRLSTTKVLSRRRVLEAYQASSLQMFQAITATSTILTYSLYAITANTATSKGATSLILTIPLVAFGILRYIHLVQAGRCGEDPARDLLLDPSLGITVLCWLIATIWSLT